MSKSRFICALMAACALALSVAIAAPIPTSFTYQGLLTIDGTPHNGEAIFKFALVDTSEGVYYWSNDGTQGRPEAGVPLNVVGGQFSVLLGGDPMPAIDPADLVDFRGGFALRVWVDAGNGELQLGDLPLASTLFAHHAYYAHESPGAFTADGMIWSQGTGFKFPDGTVQSTAAGGGGGGASTLDEAYDGGGAGAGRTINADAGAVAIGGNNWDVTNTYGDLMVGDATYNLRVGVATGGVGAGTARVRAAGGKHELRLGAGAHDVAKIDTTGFSVSRGEFQVDDDGQTRVVGDFGVGLGGAAFRAEHTGSSGVALWGKANSSDAALVVGQDGTGPIMKGFQNGIEKLRVDGDGRLKSAYLQVTSGEFQVDADGQTRLVGDFGPGLAGIALSVENTNAVGIALQAKTQGSDATAVFGQDGTGDIVRGFQSGALKFRVLNSGEVVTPAVTITGGADLSEPFPMSEVLADVAPGSVLVIDPENPGKLMLSDQPYDCRVAGIVSGAGGVRPGLTLQQHGTLDEGPQVALTGRVYVRVSDENGPIRPGDMITTSTTPGVGMRASDRGRSYGAVVGKAMTALEAGEGLVLVLVGLQ